MALDKKKKLYRAACVFAQVGCGLSLVWQGIRLRGIFNQRKLDKESGHDSDYTEYATHVGLFVSLLVFGILKQFIIDSELLRRFTFMNKSMFLDLLTYLLCTVLLVRQVYPNETKSAAGIGLVFAAFSLYTFGSLFKVCLQDERLHNLLRPEPEILKKPTTKTLITAGSGAAQVLCIASVIYQGTQVPEVYHPSHYKSLGYTFNGPADVSQFSIFITVIVLECLKQPVAWFALFRRSDVFMDITALTDLLVGVFCVTLLWLFSNTTSMSAAFAIVSAGLSLCTGGLLKRVNHEGRK